MRTRKDVGETLVEVMLTIVIVGLTITALLSSLATAGNAGNAQRNSVRADYVLRNYAEAIKAGAQTCIPSATYTVAYVPPTGYATTVSPTGNVCPPVDAPQLLRLTVTGSLGLQAFMQIKVSSP